MKMDLESQWDLTNKNSLFALFDAPNLAGFQILNLARTIESRVGGPIQQLFAEPLIFSKEEANHVANYIVIYRNRAALRAAYFLECGEFPANP